MADEENTINEEPKKITLRRKTVSHLQVTDSKGRSKKTVNVEVRKKRTYVKTNETSAPAPAPVAPVVIEPTPVIVSTPTQAATPIIKKETPAPAKEFVPHIVQQPMQHKTKKADDQATLEAAALKPAIDTKPKKTKLEDEAAEKQSKKAKLRIEDKRRSRPIASGSMDGDEGEGGYRRRKFKSKAPKQEFEKPVEKQIKEVMVPESITVADLAKKMAIKPAEIIRAMMRMGAIVTINQIIDQDTAMIVVEEMGHTAKALKSDDLELELAEALDHQGEEITRPPVVTIMGHVDHGKTTLLDYIRRTRVAAGEAGGITQNIGAYHVETSKGVITFLDTPGHEAFTAMRARGAKYTDIVILVVAADDGVMPQTVEAIQHARAAEVPIVVAVNKMDKHDADPERIRQELMKYSLIAENWGGDTMFVNISAKQGMGIDELLDAILLQAEVLELKAITDCPAKAVVVEARLDKGRGPVATILVQQGTLSKGDIILAGMAYGRVRALYDETGHAVDKAGPSIPVEVLGLSCAPNAGDPVVTVQDERKAREVALFRQGKFRDVKLAQKTTSLDTLFSDLKRGEIATLNIVLKAEVQGSVEALVEALQKISNNEVQVRIIASGVGGITESDVNLALASKAIIIGFNVRADLAARKIIEREGVDVHYHNIIYNVLDEVKLALTGMLKPDIKEVILGVAQVREVFRVAKLGAIAGCMIIEGTVKRGKSLRVLRENVVVFEGQLESLRRHKEDVSEVRNGMECGIGVKDYDDVTAGDLIEVFEVTSVKRTL